MCNFLTRRYLLGLMMGFVCLFASMLHAQMPTVDQTLVIQSDSTTLAEQIEILPVFNGKAWAFTARWDDNNANHLNVQKAMVELGLKGTFYLNASDDNRKAGADFARQLSKDGCSVGGHTTHHYWLTTLNPNAIFREIMLNRIAREDDTDKPINSFAFPYGNYKAWLDPIASQYISDALVRSGYHHNVYSSFVKNNPHLPDGLFSTGNQVVPGDRKINAEKFRTAIKRILDDPARFHQTDYAISLGVHSWQNAAELVKFKELLKDYAGRDDFWYCNQTEFAAYRLQAKHTQIKAVESRPGTYTISRPTSVVAGNDIPLSIVITGKKPSAVTLDGQTLQAIALGEGRWLVNLPYPDSEALPEKIDWVQFDKTNQLSVESEEFAGLHFGSEFSKMPRQNRSVKIRNNTGKEMADVRVIFRMPLVCEPGIGYFNAENIPNNTSRTLGPLLYNRNPELAFVEGSEFKVTQVDFKLDGKPGRVYLTEDGNPGHLNLGQVTLRDATHVLGPIAPEQLDWEALVAQSAVGATRVAINDTPLGKWFKADDEDRQLLSHKRFVQYNRDPEWKKAAGKFNRKPALLAASLDVNLKEDSPLTLRADSDITHVAIDGEVVTLTKYVTPVLKAGKHRIVLVVDTKGRKVFYKPYPVLLVLKVSNGEVTLAKAN